MYASTRLPVGAIAIASVAALIHLPGPAWTVVVVGNVMLLGLLAYDVSAAPRPAALHVRRSAPRVLSVGRTDTVSLHLHNPTRRRLTLTVRDATPPSLGRRPARHRLSIDPEAWAQVDAVLRPSRRGHSSVGPVTIRASGPMGLGGRQSTLPLMDAVRVYPALPARAEIQLRVERARLLQTGERSSTVRGGGTDFDSLREYHPDDEFRRINWQATARAAKPITNVFREDRNQQVLLVLDIGRSMAGTVAGVSRFEYGLDAAVAIADLATRVGDQVGMAAFDGRIRVLVGPRAERGQPRRILDALFAQEPSLEAANYTGAFASVLSMHGRRSLLILLTELADEAVLEPLFTSLPALLARHLVIVAAVADPDTEALARRRPASSEDAYLKAAAAESTSGRRRSAARLGRLGAVVVDEPPSSLAGRLADQYLRIKAAGRL